MTVGLVSGPLPRGIPGVPGVRPFSSWTAVLHAKGDVVKHDGETLWLCIGPLPTMDEPSDASPAWTRWLDASAAEVSAQKAIDAVAQINEDRTDIVEAREAVAADRDAIAADRQAVTGAAALVQGIIDTTATNRAAAVAAAGVATGVKANLDGRFYPPSDTDPTGAVEGGTATPILAGARYLNTATGRERVFDGSAWRDYTGDAQAAAQTATTKAGQVATAKTAIDAAKADLDARFYPAAATDPTGAVVGGTATPIQEGARYLNTTTGKERICHAGAWHDYDEAAQAAAADLNARFYPAAATDPTGIVGGTAVSIQDGARYLNTGSGKERIYRTGVGWRDYDADVQTALVGANGASATATTQAAIAQAGADAASKSASTAAAVVGVSNLTASARAVLRASDVVGLCPISTTADRGGEGDWTSKCSAASWQAFGPFPKQAVAILRYPANTLSIMSRSDPSGPTWATWTVSGVAVGVVDYCNGLLRFASGSAVVTLDFVRDRVLKRDNAGLQIANQNIANFNQGTAVWTQVDTNSIANSQINDFASGILPLTPLDPLRASLAGVTLAAASNGGVSIVRADGVVVRSAATSAVLSCCFTRAPDPAGAPLLWTLATTGVSVTSQFLAASWDVAGRATFTAAQLPIGTLKSIRAMGANMVAVLGASGVARILLDPVNPAASLIHIKTTAYDSGWMTGAQGGVKFATAESVAVLAGASPSSTVVDRSPAGNNAAIVGSLTQAALAGTADQAGFSGFSAANYLQVAYAAAFDPGSGDLNIKADLYLAAAAASSMMLIDRAATGGSGAYYRLDTDSSGKPRFSISDGTNSASVTAPNALTAGVHRVRGIRRSGSSRIEIELDGVIVATAATASVGSLTNASAVLRFGLSAAGAAPWSGSLGQMQVAMTAPTTDQVAMMWAGLSHALAPGSVCILTSGPQAIAFDADTDQLGVATTSGVDVFRGRVKAVNDNSATALPNLAPTANLPAYWTTPSNASVGAQVAGPTNWGGWLLPISENATTAIHSITGATFTAPASAHRLAVPIKAGSRGWVMIVTGSVSLYVNAATGAVGAAANCTALPSVALPDGSWLAQFTFTGPAAAASIVVRSATAGSGTTSIAGDNGASGPAFYVGSPLVRSGSAAFTASDYIGALSGSENALLLAFAGGDVVSSTANGVDYFLAAVSMLRDTAKAAGVARRPIHDPTWAIYAGVTTDATATVFAAAPIAEGKAYRFRATVAAAQWGGIATEKMVYDITGIVSRDLGGNVVVVSTTTTVSEVTASCDCVAQANTTAQTLELKATGKAATRIAWMAGLELYDLGLMAAA